ncbi:hypothetical protein TruAng_011096 [Truncatella angustata]|nr:hypothetical protein TruAng_011096 [Truncatella angustata]
MRLINVKTLELHEYFGDSIPQYAILSHTWGDQEVTYEEWLYAQRQNPRRWGWVHVKEEIDDIKSKTGYRKISEFRRSRWFTRGWTLQELIAPLRVLFLSSSWDQIGTKTELSSLINEITTISITVLQDPTAQGACPVAEKMAWASERKTTREEDTAYCLMGLFDVNMPLLYGEGNKAFLRLQLEIIRQRPDVTILAWQQVLSKPRNILSIITPWGMKPLKAVRAFASSPQEFSFTEGLNFTDYTPTYFRVDGFGIAIRLPLIKTLATNFFFAILPHVRRRGKRMVWIPLVHIGEQRYVRVDFPVVTFDAPETNYGPPTEIFLPTHEGHLFHLDKELVVVQKPGLYHNQITFTRTGPVLLFTFPCGYGEFKLTHHFPGGFDPGRPSHSLLQRLYISDDDPLNAFGSLEFYHHHHGHQKRLEILFLVRLANKDDSKPAKWTCRDISNWPISVAEYMNRNYGTKGLSVNEVAGQRYRPIIESLYHQPSSSGKHFWRSEEKLWKGYEGAEFDGHALMDNGVYDPSNAAFLSPLASERTLNVMNQPGPWITVQINFPTVVD